MQTIKKCLLFVGGAKAAAEVAHSVVIAQGQGVQKFFQFLKTLLDLWRIGFVGVGVGQVELVQDGGAIITT